jgi:hypothetical protein
MRSTAVLRMGGDVARAWNEVKKNICYSAAFERSISIAVLHVKP